MCKLFIATGKLSPWQVKQATLEANQKFKCSQRDGFGFMAAGPSGVALGRYLEPERFPGWKVELPENLRGEQEELGELGKDTDVLFCHGRTGTGAKGMVAVHPFELHGSYLIHNGSVMWNGPKEEEPQVACDSNQVLHWIMRRIELEKCPWGEMKENFGGWGVVGFYNHPTKTVSIARDGARLHFAKRQHGAGWLFATDRDDLLAIARAASINIEGQPVEFMDGRLAQVSAGKCFYADKWTGFGARSYYSGPVTVYHNGQAQTQLDDKEVKQGKRGRRRASAVFDGDGVNEWPNQKQIEAAIALYTPGQGLIGQPPVQDGNGGVV